MNNKIEISLYKKISIIKSITDIKGIFESEIIQSENFRNINNLSVFAGIEPDPRGIPLYSMALIHYLKRFAENGFGLKILIADYHSRLAKRPWVVNAKEDEIDNIIKCWRKLFEINDIKAMFYISSNIILEDEYQNILKNIQNSKNKLKYLPKEFRDYYKRIEHVPPNEWGYVNLEVADVLYFKPTIFYSDMPERPLHIALHEKAKNTHLPISFLSPTVPPITPDMPAPTFYWITDFRNRDTNIITLRDSKAQVESKVNGYFKVFDYTFYAILYIWVYIIYPQCSNDGKIYINKREYDIMGFINNYLKRKIPIESLRENMISFILNINERCMEIFS